MKVSSKYLKIAAEPDFKKVGQKKTPLLRLFTLDETSKKNENGEWEVTNTTAVPAVLWGKKANEARLDLQKGDVLDISATVEENRNGEFYVKHRAIIEENSYQNKQGEDISEFVITIFDYNKWEFNNDN